MVPRIGFVVSNKVAKRANRRNKIKRQLRAIVRANLSDIQPGYDYLIIVRSPILKKNYQEIKEKTLTLIKKIKSHQ